MNETTFSFDNYVTKMKQLINVLENFNISLYKDDKFMQLLDNINCPKTDLETEVNICRSSHSASFDTASTYISTVISRLLTETQPSSGRCGRRMQVNSSGRVLRGGIGR